jgi:hypothetical protein
LCKGSIPLKERFTSKNCGHIFCKKCVSKSFYDYQWFDDFSTENDILCPECDLKMSDNDFQAITSYLCDTFVLQRTIVYKTWMCAEQYLELKYFVEIGREYTPNQFQHVNLVWNKGNRWSIRVINHNNSIPDIVYFKKWPDNYRYRIPPDEIRYSFWYSCQTIIDHFKNKVTKELIEKVFHPDNLKKLGFFDDEFNF